MDVLTWCQPYNIIDTVQIKKCFMVKCINFLFRVVLRISADNISWRKFKIFLSSDKLII